MTPEHAGATGYLIVDETMAPPPNRRRHFVGLVLVGTFLALASLGVVVILALRQPVGGGVAVGTMAVLGLVAGSSLVLLGVGGLLFGWMGGRPYFPVGSHRSVVATTTFAGLLGVILGLGVLRAIGNRGENIGEVASVVSATVYGMFLVMFYVQGVRPGIVTRETLGLKPGLLLKGVATGVSAALVVMIYAAAYGLVLQALKLQQPQMEDFRWLSGRTFADFGLYDYTAVLAIVVLGPLVEELYFRGYVFNAYQRSWGIRMAYVASSGIFAAVHVYPAILLAIFGMGMILAWSYRRSGTIVTSIVAHVLNNGFAIFTLMALGNHGGFGS